MYNISTIKTQVQYFLFPAFIFIFFSFIAFAEDLQPEADSVSRNQYVTTLEAAISDYKEIAANGGWEAFKTGNPIKIGTHDARIPVIRRILSVMGDYKGEKDNDSDILDGELAEAVKNFQIRHGLEVDGALGKKTQAALAVPVEFRLAQMQTTLERVREMPDLGDRYVLVNVPGFYLKAVDKNATVITSRIIVGAPKNATPLFHRPITDVSFNPAWHVPERIARNEFMGKLRSNPDYFSKGNYVITDRSGETVNIADIDWENNSENQYKFIQRAGNGNALGKVKFNLPDTDNIYLHSTGSPQLFAKAERALSHGCIRVEMARELTYFVMSGLNDWDEERIAKLYDSNKSKILPITPVAVYLVYWTSWVDETTKQPHFHTDIYGRDKKRVSAILAELKDRKNADELEVAMK